MTTLAEHLLLTGEIAVIPTDTVYGVVARASDRQAVARLYHLKRREGKPGTLVAASIDQLVDLGVRRQDLNEGEKLWPGAVSIIVPCSDDLYYIHQGVNSLAIRIPDDPWLLDLLKKTGPLLTSSANQPGEPPATTTDEARKYFGDQVEWYEDGGYVNREPSTVIKVSDGVIEVIRQGAMKLDETSKLSRLYRNDALIDLDPTLRKNIDELYLPTLQNMSHSNPKILVVFSGGNAIGKSTLSARLANEFHGIVIENDAIKRAILELQPDIDRSNELNPLTWRYSMDLYARLESLTNNGLVIRDGIIDWYFDRILPLFEKNGYRIFVVQINVSKEKAAELIIQRGDMPTITTEALLRQLEDHETHQQRFRGNYSADVILDEHNLFDHDAIVAALRLVISQTQ